ncbi:IS66 family insertion sequence element accessory protein TnpB [uncultured Bacteroides sp.]|uniref:IS66 family insertion sequence element accessory protein TnpB n=1 Tax=uncultured Bacteroides sp. TaxID=162156 RepID=UPI002AA88951|nr:IS66 family insertion sequence element accessory protein TnpB [uncultured Bacteroides sp.]
MLTVSGLKNFYYLPHFHDMRCGYARIMEVIRMSYHRNPYKGDVFFFMSKNERSVRMVMYERKSLPISYNDMSDTEKNSFESTDIGERFDH